MTTALTIDFVSDIACPWCAVGLFSLEKALERLQGEVAAELRFQFFELNPDMGPGRRSHELAAPVTGRRSAMSMDPLPGLRS